MEMSLTKTPSFTMKNPYSIPKLELVIQFLNKGGIFRYGELELCMSEEDRLCAIEIENDEEVLYQFNASFNMFVEMCNEVPKEEILHMYLFIQEPKQQSNA